MILKNNFSWAKCVWLILLFVVPAAGQSQTITLDSLILQLNANNPMLRAGRLQAEGLFTKNAQVSALPDPTFGLAVQPFPLYTARGSQRSQWRVEQAIPFPGKRALRGDIADLSAEIQLEETNVLADDLVLQIKNAWYNLYRVQQQIALIDTFQMQLRTFEEAALAQYDVGTGMQQAVLKSQLERNALEIKRSRLDAKAISALELIKNILGLTGDNLDGLQAKLNGLSSPENADVVTALNQRNEALALGLARRRADAQLALARKNYMPDFKFSFTYFDVAQANIPASSDGRDALAIGVGIKIPLWRGKLKASVTEAEIRQRTVDTRLEALTDGITTMLSGLENNLQETNRQKEWIEQTLIPQAESVLEATLSAYTTGRTDFLNLLDAERMLFNLKLEHIEIVTNIQIILAKRDRVLGN